MRSRILVFAAAATLNLGCGDGPILSQLQAAVEAAPSAIDFGPVTVGESATESIQIRNTGDLRLPIEGFTVAAPFAADGGEGVPLALEPDQGFELPVRFAPDVEGTFEGQVEIKLGALTQVVPLAGTALRARVPHLVAGTALNFEAVPLGTEKSLPLQVENTGDADIRVLGVQLQSTGNDARSGEHFRVLSDFPIEILAGSATQIPVIFAPSEEALYVDKLLVTAPGQDFEVALSGSGLFAPTLRCTPGVLDFGVLAAFEVVDAHVDCVPEGGDIDVTSVRVRSEPFRLIGWAFGAVPSDRRFPLKVRFTAPAITGAYEGTLTVEYRAAGADLKLEVPVRAAVDTTL